MIDVYTPVQTTIVIKSRREIIRGRVWAVADVPGSPRYAVLPEGKLSLADVVHDIPEDRLQVLAVKETQPIRLVKP